MKAIMKHNAAKRRKRLAWGRQRKNPSMVWYLNELKRQGLVTEDGRPVPIKRVEIGGISALQNSETRELVGGLSTLIGMNLPKILSWVTKTLTTPSPVEMRASLLSPLNARKDSIR